MRRLVLLIIGLLTIGLLLSVPCFSQAKHPFTFEDMMELKRVGEPVPSPDGKWVLFSAVDVDLAANTKTPHIWIVPDCGRTGAGDHRRSGCGPSALGAGRQAVRVSLDERRRIAGLDCGLRRSAQARVTGRHKLTSIATEAGGESGRRTARTFFLPPMFIPNAMGRPRESRPAMRRKSKSSEKSKVKALIFDRLLYRHWNAYKEGKRRISLLCRLMRCEGQSSFARPDGRGRCPYAAAARDLTPGDLRRPVVLARRAGQLRLLARWTGDLLHLEPRQGRSDVHQQRSVDRPGQRRRGWAGEEHHRRQSRQRLDSALFARWQVHRLPRAAASGIRERPVPADAV